MKPLPSSFPSPLSRIAFDVRVLAGLAVVRCERVFRNQETSSIEATMTFPMPVLATMTSLKASIDGRELVGKAQARQEARATYEAGLDAGKTSVLHEEALKGIHVISVGHVPPGADVTVVAEWVQPLGLVRHQGRIWIPTTVGDVYGVSPLGDVDDFRRSASAHYEATVTVAGRGVHINGEKADSAAVVMNAPIDITLAFEAGTVAGLAADGGTVVLRSSAVPSGHQGFTGALLIDRSGSMGQDGRFAFAKAAAARVLAEFPSTKLWEFANSCHPVPSIDQLTPPGEGTSIGPAVGRVLSTLRNADLLLVTDGQSYDIDIQALARTAHERDVRIHAVLVGAGALEANIGHLCSLTGGITSAVECDPMSAVDAVLAGTSMSRINIRTDADSCHRQFGAIEVLARWGKTDAQEIAGGDARALGAFAASMRLPALSKQEATELAIAEGLVTHLTSLVLVDEAGTTQEGIPAQRAVPMMVESGFNMSAHGLAPSGRLQPACSGMFRSLSQTGSTMRASTARLDAGGQSSSPTAWSLGGDSACLRHDSRLPPSPRMPMTMPTLPPRRRAPQSEGLHTLSQTMRGSDSLRSWQKAGAEVWGEPDRLARGDLSGLPSALVVLIVRAAAMPRIVELAAKAGVSPTVLVLALFARCTTSRSHVRTASRFCRPVITKLQPAEYRDAESLIGLAMEPAIAS